MAQGRYHWSNCAHEARFVRIHYLGCLPWLILIVHASWNTLYFAVGVTALLLYIEVWKKMTLKAFFRSVIASVTGRVKTTVNLAREIGR